jgi:hypothetical protein
MTEQNLWFAMRPRFGVPVAFFADLERSMNHGQAF